MGAMASSIVERTDNKTKSKNPAIDFIDEALLNKIASETGGKYFRARDKDGLKAVTVRLINWKNQKLILSLIKDMMKDSCLLYWRHWLSYLLKYFEVYVFSEISLIIMHCFIRVN